MTTTLATWGLAPDWLTPAQAAALLGPGYSEESILTLIEIGAVVAEQDDAGAWRIDKLGLAEYQEALWEVLSYDD